jgi:predicted transcriptional regulator
MDDLNSDYTSDDYAKEYLLNKTDEKIIMYLINNNNEPTYAAEIAREFKADKSWLKGKCEELIDKGILLSENKCATRYKYTEHYYLGDMTDVLNYLYAQGSKSLIDHIMTKDYYKSQIDNLISNFENKRVSSGHNVFSANEKEVIQLCLKYSYKALYVVLGIYDCEELSGWLVYEHKVLAKHLKQGRFISVSAIAAAIVESEVVAEDKQVQLLNEIHDKALSSLTPRVKHFESLLDKSKVPILFEQILCDYPFLELLTAEEDREQLRLDVKRVHFLVNDIMDPSFNPILEKDEKDRYAHLPSLDLKRSSS